MSQVAEMPKANTQSVKIGEVIIKGRCTSAKRNGSLFSHLIVLPAPDPYSSPATVEVLSKNRQADSEQDITLHCRIGGYRRSYKSTDRETGEVRTIVTADNKLFVVED